MSSLHSKNNDFISKYGRAAYSNLFLIVHLIQICRTVNLNRLKLKMSHILRRTGHSTTPSSHYKRLCRFFQDYGNDPVFLRKPAYCSCKCLKQRAADCCCLTGQRGILTVVTYIISCFPSWFAVSRSPSISQTLKKRALPTKKSALRL